MLVTIDELPHSMQEFKDSINTVLFTEKLSNPNCSYYIEETSFDYRIRITGIPEVKIPKNASKFTPPTVNIYEHQIIDLSVKERGELINKLKKIGILEYRTRNWMLIFTKLDCFYDFYTIWSEYRLS